jgi:hypothetical protein
LGSPGRAEFGGEAMEEAAKKTLYEQLGGYDAISVADIVEA